MTNSLARRARSLLLNLLDDHEVQAGIGSDRYNAAPCYHAMADGKYLSALAVAAGCGVVSPSRHQGSLNAAIERLEQHNLSSDPGLACWGLGFAWESLPETEPYLITTAMVAEGLLDNAPHLPIVDKCIGWLGGYPCSKVVSFGAPGGYLKIAERRSTHQTDVPTFSPGIDRPVANAIAAWAGALWRVRDEVDRRILEKLDGAVAWLASVYEDPVGWRYEPGGTRIDLTHVCIILRALCHCLDPHDIQTVAQRILANFHCFDRLIYKLDLTDRVDAARAAEASSSVRIAPAGDAWVIRHAEKADLWAHSEQLTLLSILSLQETASSYWRITARRAALHMLEEFPALETNLAAFHTRDKMFAAHAMASLLRSIRSEGP